MEDVVIIQQAKTNQIVGAIKKVKDIIEIWY